MSSAHEHPSTPSITSIGDILHQHSCQPAFLLRWFGGIFLRETDIATLQNAFDQNRAACLLVCDCAQFVHQLTTFGNHCPGAGNIQLFIPGGNQEIEIGSMQIEKALEKQIFCSPFDRRFVKI